nr:unnamed protein product [Digitaria exilis]
MEVEAEETGRERRVGGDLRPGDLADDGVQAGAALLARPGLVSSSPALAELSKWHRTTAATHHHAVAAAAPPASPPRHRAPISA